MIAVLTLALQASASPKPAPIGFDLANMDADKTVVPSPTPEKECASQQPDEIVVCGSPAAAGKYRLRPLPAAPGISRAAMDLGGGVTARAHLGSVEIAPGMVSKRTMLTIGKAF